MKLFQRRPEKYVDTLEFVLFLRVCVLTSLQSVETASDLGENNAIDDNNQVVDFNDDLEFQSSYIQDKHRELVLVDGLAQNRVFAPESLPIWKSLSLSRYSQTLPSFDLPRVVEDEASPDATPATDPELEAQNPTKGVAIPSNPTSNGMSNSPEEHLDRPSLEIVPVSNQPPPVGQVGHQIITSTTNETGEETAARRPLISASKKVTTSSQEERGAATKVLSYFKRRSTKDEPHEPLPIQPGYKDISNVVCGHYRVGKKIGERSTSVVFEGVDLSNDRKVFITFVRYPVTCCNLDLLLSLCKLMRELRNREKQKKKSYDGNIGTSKSSPPAVSLTCYKRIN